MSPKKRKTDKRSPLEWSVLGSSIAAIGALVISLLTSSLRVADSPPDLSIELGAPEEASGGLAYPLVARNTGGESAQDVEIDVTIGSVVRTLTLVDVARQDQAHGVVVFPAGTSGNPTAEVTSYAVDSR